MRNGIWGVSGANVFYSVIDLAERAAIQPASHQQKLKPEKGISFPPDKSGDFQGFLSLCTLIL